MLPVLYLDNLLELNLESILSFAGAYWATTITLLFAPVMIVATLRLFYQKNIIRKARCIILGTVDQLIYGAGQSGSIKVRYKFNDPETGEIKYASFHLGFWEQFDPQFKEGDRIAILYADCRNHLVL